MKTRTTLTYSPGAFGPILAALGEDYLGWQDFAACAEVDPAIFHPDKGGGYISARAICDDCPVRAECLEYALEYEARGDVCGLFGMFGGLTADEREAIIRSRRMGAAA